MNARVVRCEGSHRLSGDSSDDGLVSWFLDHLVTRGFSSATVRAYAFDLANFLAFLAARGLCVQRVRAVVLAMVLGGLRSAEVRSLRIADIDMGTRRVRVIGKGNRERLIPVERVFFDEVAAYLRGERPAGFSTPECFVVLRGPTTGAAMTEAGLRKVFRVHRERTGAMRVR